MKTKLTILFLTVCLMSFSQSVPNTETFSLLDVRSAIGADDAVARVDIVTKSGDPQNCTVSCNGFTEEMEWNSNPNVTVLNFISNYGESFGAVTLENYGYGQISFTANTPGVDFAQATITGNDNTAENLIPNYTGALIGDLIAAYSSASIPKFDRQYYPNYQTTGVHNSLLNFRNFGAALRPPLHFIVRERQLYSLYLIWTDNSWDENGFEIERSTDGNNWSLVETTAPNTYQWWNTGLTQNTTYYYRIRSFNSGGYSSWVTTEGVTLYLDPEDWYLPSLGELALMYNNLRTYNVGDFSSQIYWSSTETSTGTTEAVGISFQAPMTYVTLNKTTECSVRAARHFNGTYGQYQLRDVGPRGGLIFYIVTFGTQRVYYEAHPEDQSALYIWSNVTNSRAGTYINIESSQFNTIKIFSQPGHTSSAAQLCDQL
jgi:hypothetical protein